MQNGSFGALETEISARKVSHVTLTLRVHALEQIKWARSAHRVDAGVVLTTATTLSDAFTSHQQALEAELGIDIRVLTREDFLRLLMTHLGKVGTSA